MRIAYISLGIMAVFAIYQGVMLWLEDNQIIGKKRKDKKNDRLQGKKD